ncbi:polysaccharide biosynthesis/export family protein [Orrella sp. JC864]|uniref:polysaccharide biosynthesis/export family protein n=1 Tax=Orrella sp. JC864 TaxID=3120298 RepID=UPI00300A7104
MTESSLSTPRLMRLLATIGCAAVLSGCGGFLSGAGPYMGSITAEQGQDPPYRLIDLSASTIGPYMPPAPPPGATSVSSTTAPTVRLVAGDVIKVLISDSPQPDALFAPLAAGGTSLDVRVESNGEISLPYAGRMKVAGMSLSEVENSIKTRLKGAATIDPQVLVSLVGDISGSVLVAGAVKQPGRFSALQGPLTLLDAVNMAGGPILEPHLVNVIVRNGSEIRTVSYQDLLSGQNTPVQPRSEIVLERARKRFVAMGAVGSPGLHDLPSQYPNLLETLGVVGGLKENSANPQGVFVFRLQDNGPDQPQAEVFRLNMRDPSAIFLARQFLIKPDDAIYVTNAAVYEWQKIISPIVQVLVLGRTVNGF